MKHFFRKKKTEAVTILSNVILLRWNFETVRRKRNVAEVGFKGLRTHKRSTQITLITFFSYSKRKLAKLAFQRCHSRYRIFFINKTDFLAEMFPLRLMEAN